MKTATKLAPKRAGSRNGLNGAAKIRVVPKEEPWQIRMREQQRERMEAEERLRLEVIRKRDFPTPEELAEKLKGKKEMLECRRWKIVLDEVLEAIKKSKAADVTVDLVDLVVIFGTSYTRAPRLFDGDSHGRGKMWPWLDTCRKGGYPTEQSEEDATYSRKKIVGERNRDEALWAALKPVICDQLGGFRLVGDIIKEKVDVDIRRVAALIAFPVEARKCTANFKLRVPKAWGKGLDIHTLEPIAPVAIAAPPKVVTKAVKVAKKVAKNGAKKRGRK